MDLRGMFGMAFYCPASARSWAHGNQWIIHQAACTFCTGRLNLARPRRFVNAPVNRYEVPAAVEKPKGAKGQGRGPVPLASLGP